MTRAPAAAPGSSVRYARVELQFTGYKMPAL
jgi:hypothetical protein